MLTSMDVKEEWGVRRAETGEIVVCGSETEARAMAEQNGGTLMMRKVYETDWTDLAGRNLSQVLGEGSHSE